MGQTVPYTETNIVYSTIDQVLINLRNRKDNSTLDLKINVLDCNLSRKWLTSLNYLLSKNFHLEKNYLFHGWSDSERNGDFICNKINETFDIINKFNSTGVWQSKGLKPYSIDQKFLIKDILSAGEVGDNLPGCRLDHDRCNVLHHYFEDLQGTSEQLSLYYKTCDDKTKWHIRQLNNLCHELESWATSYRKKQYLADWQRPSMIFCFLNSPRFKLDDEDLDAFGIDTIARDFGGVYLGVNKAVGKHHFEVFRDEDGADINSLETTTMKGHTIANGDFDIDWGQSDRHTSWRAEENQAFTEWLEKNGFDPNDKTLTIGHPKIGQVDLDQSFASSDIFNVWNQIYSHMDVYKISTADASAEFDYHWSDSDYPQQQIKILKPGYDYSSRDK